MDLEDVLNEMMDSSSSSSDDDDELYIAAAHVVSDIANSACHRGCMPSWFCRGTSCFES